MLESLVGKTRDKFHKYVSPHSSCHQSWLVKSTVIPQKRSQSFLGEDSAKPSKYCRFFFAKNPRPRLDNLATFQRTAEHDPWIRTYPTRTFICRRTVVLSRAKGNYQIHLWMLTSRSTADLWPGLPFINNNKSYYNPHDLLIMKLVNQIYH